MKQFETLLKLLFLIGSVFFICTRLILIPTFMYFLAICLILGVTLLLNDKHPSYTYPKKYPKNGTVLALRRFEGAIVISFAVAMLGILNTL